LSSVSEQIQTATVRALRKGWEYCGAPEMVSRLPIAPSKRNALLAPKGTAAA
jgi:hypothetical protein